MSIGGGFPEKFGNKKQRISLRTRVEMRIEVKLADLSGSNQKGILFLQTEFLKVDH